jgi:WD40 repeat protein
MRFVLALGAAALLANGAEPSMEWRLYRAAIAAADGALQLEGTSAAKRWLAEAPAAHRGWEWRYLSARADQSESSCKAHDAAITGLAIRADGAILATTSGDKTVKLWDARNCSPIATFDGGAGATWSPAFRPGTDEVAAIGSDGSLRVWSVRDRKETRRIDKLGNGLGAIAWSPDGALLAAGTWTVEKQRGVVGWLHVWKFATGELVWKAEYGVKPITTLAFRPDGRQFAAANWDAQVGFFDPAGAGKPSAEARVNAVDGSYPAMQSVTYSPDGKILIAASKDGIVRQYDTASARLGRELTGHMRWANGAAFAPGGSWFVSASSDETLRIWDAQTGALRRAVRGHTASVNAVAVSPDGNRIVSAGADGSLRWWRAGLADSARDLWTQSKDVYGFAFSADGTRAASASWGGLIKLWDSATGRALWEKQIHDSSANAVAFSPDGKRLVSGGNDGRLQLVDAANGSVLATWERVGDGRAAGIAWSPDGRAVFSPSSRPSGKLWNAATGQILRTVTGGKGEIYDAVFSRDSRWLAVAWTGGEVKAIDWEQGQDIATLPVSGAAYAVAFHPSGKLLATAGGDRRIRLWELPSARLLQTLEGHTELVFDLDFTPDGSRLASASTDQTVRLWAPDTADCLLTIAFPVQVYGVRFSPDGRRLAATPMNGTIRLFDTAH